MSKRHRSDSPPLPNKGRPDRAGPPQRTYPPIRTTDPHAKVLPFDPSWHQAMADGVTDHLDNVDDNGRRRGGNILRTVAKGFKAFVDTRSMRQHIGICDSAAIELRQIGMRDIDARYNLHCVHHSNNFEPCLCPISMFAVETNPTTTDACVPVRLPLLYGLNLDIKSKNMVPKELQHTKLLDLVGHVPQMKIITRRLGRLDTIRFIPTMTTEQCGESFNQTVSEIKADTVVFFTRLAKSFHGGPTGPVTGISDLCNARRLIVNVSLPTTQDSRVAHRYEDEQRIWTPKSRQWPKSVNKFVYIFHDTTFNGTTPRFRPSHHVGGIFDCLVNFMAQVIHGGGRHEFVFVGAEIIADEAVTDSSDREVQHLKDHFDDMSLSHVESVVLSGTLASVLKLRNVTLPDRYAENKVAEIIREKVTFLTPKKYSVDQPDWSIQHVGYPWQRE